EENTRLCYELSVIKAQNECLLREKTVLEKLVAELEFSNQLLKEKMINEKSSFDIGRSGSYTTSYSDVVQKPRQQVVDKQTSAVLIVKSKNGNVPSSTIEKAIKSSCNPAEHKINVERTTQLKNGVLITCKDSASLDKLKVHLNEQVGEIYN